MSSYRVRAGDTLSSIARRHGCSIETLQSANPGIEPRRMAIGSTLIIPDVREQQTVRRPADKRLDPSANRGRPNTQGAVTSTMREVWERIEEGTESSTLVHGIRLWHGLGEEVLAWLREVESTQAVHTTARALTTARKPEERSRAPKLESGAQPASVRNAARKHRDEVLQKLRDRLYAIPQVVETSGVPLTRNERKMIVAAVGLCEISNDVFGSLNKDQEFVGRKFGKRGIELGYSRVVHIGLSYGYIQYTQDSGSLGRVLQRMSDKVGDEKFKRYFPNAEQLIQMTTEGLPDEQYSRYGKSGQAYWSRLSKKDRQALTSRASRDADKDKLPDDPLSPEEEIRGARVQKIPYADGYPPIDLWEDYERKPPRANYLGWASALRAAGDVPEFQDAQLDLAVEDYFNRVLKYCQDSEIRSATGLAMVLAGAVRGGPSTSNKLVTLLVRVGEQVCGIKGKFDTAQQELDAVKAIAQAKADKGGVAKVGSVTFPAIEQHRAAKLLKDEFDFLREDHYDPATYYPHDAYDR